MSEKYFLTSDVHSYYDELIETLNEAGFDPKNHDHFSAFWEIFLIVVLSPRKF